MEMPWPVLCISHKALAPQLWSECISQESSTGDCSPLYANIGISRPGVVLLTPFRNIKVVSCSGLGHDRQRLTSRGESELKLTLNCP